jgi:hypothetical protein
MGWRAFITRRGESIASAACTLVRAIRPTSIGLASSKAKNLFEGPLVLLVQVLERAGHRPAAPMQVHGYGGGSPTQQATNNSAAIDPAFAAIRSGYLFILSKFTGGASLANPNRRRPRVFRGLKLSSLRCCWSRGRNPCDPRHRASATDVAPCRHQLHRSMTLRNAI